jgi:hypothetical protein
MLTRRLSLASSLLLLALAAGGSWGGFGCSSSSAEASGADGGGSDATTETSTSDASVDSGEAGAGDQSGFVYVISDSTTTDGGTKSDYRAGASFVRTTAPDTSRTTKTVGPCEVETLNASTPSEVDVSAGTVHIEGGSAKLDLVPTASAAYDELTAASLLFAGGESLSVRADGKDVPAFTTMLVAPSKVTLSAPAPTMGTLTITKSAGLTASFTGASSGKVVFYLSATTATQAYSARCKFPANATTAQIPAEALSDLPAGDGFYDFYVEERSDVAPPGWNVHFTASKAIVDPAGVALQGPAVFQ